ncbi:hypothetical protein, partial [Prosthecobacter sp.]|uniref:hypothetical protein n=1 Tax=Prosthecobacter sp. TaxID=1965333 RepID=UPI002486CE47
ADGREYGVRLHNHNPRETNAIDEVTKKRPDCPGRHAMEFVFIALPPRGLVKVILAGFMGGTP